MTTVINCEREALDFDSVPEYFKENQLPTREAAVSMSSQFFSGREKGRDARPANEVRAVKKEREVRAPGNEVVLYNAENEAPASDELEALWPGVHHDFVHAPRKNGSFYATVGFMAGSALSLLCVFGYSQVSSNLMASKPVETKQVIASANIGKAPNAVPGVPQTVTGQDGSETLVPAANNYEVQPGDTLASIAQRNYKRVSPRLLDQICRANSMRNANVLSLGQKLTLPEYHAQTTQVAATSAAQVQ
ncbi:MAG TPA: LysM domain-containing protein [Drouetiella sp.]